MACSAMGISRPLLRKIIGIEFFDFVHATREKPTLKLEGRIKPKVIVNIDHRCSHDKLALQAVDLFSWGIFRKYERGDTSWLDIYQEKIQLDQQYL